MTSKSTGNPGWKRWALAGALLLAACGDKPAPAPAPLTVRALSAADVQVAQRGLVVDRLPFTGSLNPLTSSVVSSEAEGTVLAVAVREGELVRRGQVLARIDSRSAREAVGEQEARVASSQSQLALAQIKLEKQRELFAKGFISKLAFEEQSSAYQVAVAELRAQQTQLTRARKTLSDSIVRAPIDGVVYQRKINPGEQAQRSSSLFSIADLSVLEVTASIPSTLVGRLRLGMPAQFTIEGGSQPEEAKLVRMNPVALSGTRSFAVYLQVDNRAGRLRAGQFVQGGIALRQVADQIVLPLTAVHDIDQQPWVMLITAGKLQRLPVRVALRSDSTRQVAVAGITPGQTVLVGSLLGLKAGDAVSLPNGH